MSTVLRYLAAVGIIAAISIVAVRHAHWRAP
jgi:hypothetical protein